MKTIKTKKFNKIAQRSFAGDCVTGLNSKYFRDWVANDATLLSSLVENGEEINRDNFFKACFLDPEVVNKLNKNSNNYKFYYNRNEDVAWYYDIGADVEYFYI